MSGVRSVQCRAKSKRSGVQCRQWAMRGQQVCQIHGGKSPGALRKARERIALAELYADLERVRPDVALQTSVAAAMAVVARLRQAMGVAGTELDPEALDVLGRWLDRLSRMAKDAVSADLSQREVELEEETAARMVQAVSAVVKALGHDVDDPATRAKVHRALTLVAGSEVRMIEGGLG